jgi:retron-type reverse transcriptase
MASLDKPIRGQIWLKAGVLEPDQQIVNLKSGTPQGGSISPILANVYLHFVLDIWFEGKVKKECAGEAYTCRYADDFICALRFKRDAVHFMGILKERFNKFDLELAEEKTNLISFSRWRKEEETSFDFLGFEFRWGVDRKGKRLH